MNFKWNKSKIDPNEVCGIWPNIKPNSRKYSPSHLQRHFYEKKKSWIDAIYFRKLYICKADQTISFRLSIRELIANEFNPPFTLLARGYIHVVLQKSVFFQRDMHIW